MVQLISTHHHQLSSYDLVVVWACCVRFVR